MRVHLPCRKVTDLPTSSDFERWFTELTSHDSARKWQGELADEESCRDRLIRIPTGLGKTEGVLAAWSFHRIRSGR